MPTWYLLTCRQCSPVSPERVARLRRTRGERWAIVRVGEGELGTAPEDLEGELRAWWDQASPTVSDARRLVTVTLPARLVTVREAR